MGITRVAWPPLLCLALTAGAGLAQQIPPEIPLANHPGVGARALGMGGAYVAVAEDHAALAYNPAGLTQVRSTEWAGALEHRSQDSRNVFLGNEVSTPLDQTKLQSLGFAYPFPTYRGALVVGFAFDRAVPLDQDYFRAGSGAGSGIASETEAIFETGSVNAYRAGFAVEANPRLSLGVAGVIFAGSSTREREYEYASEDGRDTESSYSRTEIDYSAVSGSLGALIVLDRHARLGITMHLPEQYDLSGSGFDDILRREVDGDSTYTTDVLEDYAFEDEIGLPLRLSVGLSYVRDLGAGGTGDPGSILVAIDGTFCDWKQIDYVGPLRTPDREYVYRSTTDLHLGAEYTLPSGIPLRLRAGYSFRPLPYRLIVTDVFFGETSEARFERDRRSWSVGAGVLLERSATLDIAYTSGGYDRRGRSDFGLETEERLDERRISIGLAFRI